MIVESGNTIPEPRMLTTRTIGSVRAAVTRRYQAPAPSTEFGSWPENFTLRWNGSFSLTITQ